MRILVLNSEIPFPPITGAQLRTFNLLKALSAEHDLTLVGFSWDSSDAPTICPFPVEVIRVRWVRPEIYSKMHGDNSAASRAAYRYLACECSEPWFVSYYDSPAMAEVLWSLKPRSFDVILIEHSFMARFLPSMPPGVPKVLDMHNVHTLMAWRRVEEKSGPEKDDAMKEFERTRTFERMVCRSCQLCLCCSEQDAEAARSFLNIQHVKVIPNGVDTMVMASSDVPETPGFLLFTGMMNYEPNVEAVRYFVSDILPLIQAKWPQVSFHIAGANPPQDITALASDRVFIHGFVPDMRPYFDQAAVVVVPLLHGGGTRLKILEAAACGKAIVSTPLGAEGLNFVDGRDLLLADSAGAFAQAVVELLSDPCRRHKFSKWSRRATESYEWSKIVAIFRGSVIDVAQGVAPFSTREREECRR